MGLAIVDKNRPSLRVLGTDPRRGKIYLVALPGQPGDAKARPALIISTSVRNRLAHDVMVIPLTTNLRPAPTHVEIPAGKGGLRATSMAKCEQVTTLDKSFLLKKPFHSHSSPRPSGSYPLSFTLGSLLREGVTFHTYPGLSAC